MFGLLSQFRPCIGTIVARREAIGATPSGTRFEIPKGDRGGLAGASQNEYYASFKDRGGDTVFLIVRKGDFKTEGKIMQARNPVSYTAHVPAAEKGGWHIVTASQQYKIKASRKTYGRSQDGTYWKIPKGEEGVVKRVNMRGGETLLYEAEFQTDSGARLYLQVRPYDFGYRGRNPEFREGELVRIKGMEAGPKEGTVVEKEEGGLLGRLKRKEFYRVKVRTPEGPQTILVRESALKTLNPASEVERYVIKTYKTLGVARRAGKALTKRGYTGRLYGQPGGGAVMWLDIRKGQKVPRGFKSAKPLGSTRNPYPNVYDYPIGQAPYELGLNPSERGGVYMVTYRDDFKARVKARNAEEAKKNAASPKTIWFVMWGTVLWDNVSVQDLGENYYIVNYLDRLKTEVRADSEEKAIERAHRMAWNTVLGLHLEKEFIKVHLSTSNPKRKRPSGHPIIHGPTEIERMGKRVYIESAPWQGETRFRVRGVKNHAIIWSGLSEEEATRTFLAAEAGIKVVGKRKIR